jgi:hypothetical protein
MTRRSRSSAGVVGQSLPVSRVAVAASFQTGSWQIILGHGGHGSSETYGSLVSPVELNPVPGSSPMGKSPFHGPRPQRLYCPRRAGRIWMSSEAFS